MSDNEQTTQPLPDAQPDEMFPALTTDQQSRVAAHGRLRQVEKGEGSIVVSFVHRVLSE